MYFKVIIETGHVGAGKSCEKVCFIDAPNTVDLFVMMQRYPGLKSKRSGRYISLIKSITKDEYESGKIFKSRVSQELH